MITLRDYQQEAHNSTMAAFGIAGGWLVPAMQQAVCIKGLDYAYSAPPEQANRIGNE